jgi:glycosyltransferase involved in cell wall biosynthesis
MSKIPISVVIIAKNEEQNLPGCLKSVAWASNVIVVDGNSADQTVEIAKQYTSQIFTRDMDVEGTHRNFAYEKATERWILSLDADERVSDKLRREIEQVVSHTDSDVAGYAIPIRTFIGRRWIKAAGYYPATRLRLFRKGKFRYEDANVHPRAFLNGKRAFLTGDIVHHGYRDITHFVEKLNGQTTLEAQKWVEDGRKISGVKIVYKMCDRFSRNYFRKKGVTDGFLGYLMCVFHGAYQFFAYSKYLELKQSVR